MLIKVAKKGSYPRKTKGCFHISLQITHFDIPLFQSKITHMIRQIPVSCSRDCSGGCPLLAHVEDGVLQRVTPNTNVEANTLLSQSGCVNGFNVARMIYHPDRILHPLIRNGARGSGQFRETDWDEALDLVAERLGSLKGRYGPQSVFNMVGTGSVAGALHNTYALPMRFFALFDGCTQFHGSYSAGAHNFSVPYVLGERHRSGIDPATVQYAGLIILWGANVMDTHLGSEMGPRLREASRQGTPIIVIDPRRTRTVDALKAEWIPCRPGTDTALMQAVLHVLLSVNWVDWDFVHRYSVGFDLLADHVLGRQDGIIRCPAWAETICGTPADTIVNLARRYGQTKPTMLIPGYSIQRTFNGEETFRMTIALQTATGNLGKLGGSSGDLTNRLPKPRVGGLPVPSTTPQPSIPILVYPDAVLEGKAGGYPSDIKAIYSTGSNYLNQGSDLNKNIRAFESVEFSVCHDLFLTPTARYCDVVLPITLFVERNDIVSPDTGNYVLFSNKAVDPPGEARNDYDIFCALADRLGFGQAFSEGKSEEDWLRSFVQGSDVPDYDTFKQTGIYLGADQLRVGMSDFIADPQAHPLLTPSGKIEIASQRYHEVTGLPAVPAFYGSPRQPEFPLLLITPKSKFRIHSQGSNVAWLREREEQALWINPQDAVLRGITAGSEVEIYNQQGCVRTRVNITDEMMPGVVCLMEGVWAELDGSGTELAGSANMLSSTSGTPASRSSTTHDIPVQVRALPVKS